MEYQLVRCKLVILSNVKNSHALLTLATLNDSTSSYLKKDKYKIRKKCFQKSNQIIIT